MTAYITKRVLLFVPVLFCVALLTFLLVHAAPGSPFASEKRLSSETLQALEREYGLDQPVTRQFYLYMKNLAHGYLGRSIHYTDRTVNEIIGQALPVSMRLGGFALFIAIITGIPIGVLSAYRRNTLFDYTAMAGAMLGISLPSFVLASVLILIFCFYLPVLPAVGWGSPRTLILPALTLAAPYIAYIARITRGSMLEVLKQEYIVTARAKGVPPRDLLFSHALKNGLIPLISFLGPAAAGVLTGSVVVEKIFAIPGLGVNFVHSALHRDYFLAMGCALVYGLLLMGMNLLSDVLYGVADPRISYER